MLGPKYTFLQFSLLYLIYAIIAAAYGDYFWAFPLSQWNPILAPILLIASVLIVSYVSLFFLIAPITIGFAIILIASKAMFMVPV